AGGRPGAGRGAWGAPADGAALRAARGGTHGRNRRAGELIAQGHTAEEAVAEIGQTVEGLTTAPALHGLSGRLGVELPITEGVCAVLSGHSLTDLAARLMGRQPTEE